MYYYVKTVINNLKKQTNNLHLPSLTYSSSIGLVINALGTMGRRVETYGTLAGGGKC